MKVVDGSYRLNSLFHVLVRKCDRPVRLSEIEKTAIIKAISQFDPNARIYVFGSRADDSKRGGDLDILIFSTRLKIVDKIKIKASIFDKIEEQKIDLVITDNQDDAFVKMILEDAVELFP